MSNDLRIRGAILKEDFITSSPPMTCQTYYTSGSRSISSRAVRVCSTSFPFEHVRRMFRSNKHVSAGVEAEWHKASGDVTIRKMKHAEAVQVMDEERRRAAQKAQNGKGKDQWNFPTSCRRFEWERMARKCNGKG